MLLSACLDIIKTRDKNAGDIYRRIFEEAKSGLMKASSTDTILGSLLAFSSMLQNQHLVRRGAVTHHVLTMQSMGAYYQNICELTLKYRDSKEVVVRKAVITLTPSMAAYDSDEFEQHYLHRTMSYLQAALHKPSDRDIGGQAIDELSKRLTTSLRRYRPHLRSACVQNETLHRRDGQDHQGPLANARVSRQSLTRCDG